MVCFDWVVPVRPDQCFRPSDLKRSEWLRSEHTFLIKWSNPSRLNEIRRLEKKGEEMLTAARVLVDLQRWAARGWTMVAMQGPSVEMDCMTRFGEVWRSHGRGRRGRPCPGTMRRRGRSSQCDGDLWAGTDASILYAKMVEKNVTRCARRRGEGECKNRAALYLAGPESVKNNGGYCGLRWDISVAWGRFESRSGGNGEEGAALFIGTL
jgi:hypothetical protein